MNDTLVTVIDELTKRIAQSQSDEELQRVLKDVVKEAMHEIEAEQDPDPEKRADWRGLSGKAALLAAGIALGRKFATRDMGRGGTAIEIGDEDDEYEDLSDVVEERSGASDETDVRGDESGSESGSGGRGLPLLLLVGAVAAVAYVLFKRRSGSGATTLDDWEDPLADDEDESDETDVPPAVDEDGEQSQTDDVDEDGDSDIGSRGNAASPVEDENSQTDDSDEESDSDIGARGSESSPVEDEDGEDDSDIGSRGSEASPVEDEDEG